MKSQECGVCGRGEAVTECIIEGARMSVCRRCSSLGKEVPRQRQRIDQSRPTLKELAISTDFAKKVTDARASKGISPHELAEKAILSPVLLQKIEEGKEKPTEVVAKRLEKVLGVQLIEEDASDSVSPTHLQRSSTKSGSTLADTVVFKEKRK
jgi:putative transcription factor